MYNIDDQQLIEPIIDRYYASFSQKTYHAENNDSDFLMDLYGITPELKRQNRQYWGRELGMLWQLIVCAIAEAHCGSDYQPALRVGDDEPCDLFIGNDAIDTKYRVGSGDSGTLKKFKQYGQLLSERGYRPVFLMVRDDNLPAAITAAERGGWVICSGRNAIEYLKERTGVDVKQLIASFGGEYRL